MRRWIGGLAASALALAPTAAPAEEACAWAQYGFDPANTFQQTAACTTIDPGTVPSLRLKWFVPAPDSITASPAVADGVVYVGGWEGRFRALDADTGEERWRFDIDDPNDVAFGRIVSSAAVTQVGDRKVVLFGGGATLYVLDAADGSEVARACVDPRADPAVRCQGSEADIEIESSPAVVDVDGETWVLIGMDVHNRADIGRTGVIAFSLDEDGLRALWKFDPETLLSYTTDAAREGQDGFVVTADPLTHDAGAGHGCGGVWSSPAVDAEGDRIFFGTSSCLHEPDFNPGESMFAIELRSGKYAWHESPLVDRGEGTHLDDDFGASPNLLPGDLVGFGGKDGWYYARARADGAVAWDTHAGQAGHVQTDSAVGGMIGTAAVGEVAGEPAVFATTALSTPFDRPIDEAGPDPDERLLDDPGRMFSLHAMSVADGSILWRAPLSRQSYGAPTYANGVVLVPSTFDFTIKAFDANTGNVLWAHPLIGATSSAPVIVGDSIYVGSGTRTTDAEYKQFGGGALDGVVGPHVLSPLAGTWGFELSL